MSGPGWQIESNTIYSLMHHGWDKGVETFRNRVWANFHFDQSVSDSERAKILAQQAAASALVEALKEVSASLGHMGAEYLKARVDAALLAAGEGL